MLLSLIVTIFVVLILVWLAFWLVDFLPVPAPVPNGRPFPLAVLLKALIVVAAFIVIVDAAFGSHRLLIRL